MNCNIIKFVFVVVKGYRLLQVLHTKGWLHLIILNLALHEELSEGVKLVELRVNEAIFEKDDNSYLVINFKNQIKEVNEY